MVTLTPKEFDLLLLLAEEPGTVYTRTHILETVWDPHWYGPSKTLDVDVPAGNFTYQLLESGAEATKSVIKEKETVTLRIK